MDRHELADCLGWIEDLWGAPPSPYDDLLEAERLGALGDGPGMQDRMDHALEVAPHHPFVRRYVGETDLLWADRSVRSGQLEDGAYALKFAHRFLGDDPRVQEVRADLMERRGLTEQAIAIIRERLRQTPDSLLLQRWLARLERR